MEKREKAISYIQINICPQRKLKLLADVGTVKKNRKEKYRVFFFLYFTKMKSPKDLWNVKEEERRTDLKTKDEERKMERKSKTFPLHGGHCQR